ncbi:hypothetical protein [Halalkalibacter oceani]|uniref:hypothetical protein n=1 Tax=Halalkalibacter oceani TaxID=1653776 RepID=UPI0033965004
MSYTLYVSAEQVISLDIDCESEESALEKANEILSAIKNHIEKKLTDEGAYVHSSEMVVELVTVKDEVL